MNPLSHPGTGAVPGARPACPNTLAVLAPPAGMALETLPAWAASQRHATGEAVCVVGVAPVTNLATPAHGARTLHWLDTPQACGWVLLERETPLDTAALQAAFAEERARGFVAADAALLALARLSGALPRLSWGEAPFFPALDAPSKTGTPRRLGLYAIVDSAERLAAVLAAGVRTVQVRIKQPTQPDAAWEAGLRAQLARSIELARAAGAELFVNDHTCLATELGAPAIHLGQEDLLALGDAGRAALLASGLSLGVSSHSVWELCRARALPLRYLACGPVWATTTKDMPWVPQGLDNLAWWCRHAGVPVVAIGGILAPEQVEQTAACGADGVCLVRGLGEDPSATLPAYEAALARGRSAWEAANPEGAGGGALGAGIGTGISTGLHPSLLA